MPDTDFALLIALAGTAALAVVLLAVRLVPVRREEPR